MRTRYSELTYKSLINTVAHTNTRVSNMFKHNRNQETTRTPMEANTEQFNNNEHSGTCTY